MANLPAGMQGHLDGEVTTLCHAWRVILADGARLGFTDHDQRLLIGADAFEPQSGLTASEARESLGLSVDAMDVAGALSSEAISAGDIAAGRFDNAEVETLLVNWRDTSQSLLIRRAFIGRISTSDGGFSAELTSSSHRLDQPSGRIYRRTCDAELGEARCGAGLSAPQFNVPAMIAAFDGHSAVLVDGAGAHPAGWFAGGWLTPPGAGQRKRILAHARNGSQARLQLADRSGLQAAMPVTLTAGCDKAYATCKSKFANGVNFQGFPHLPGNDAAYSYVTEEALFDGKPLVP